MDVIKKIGMIAAISMLFVACGGDGSTRANEASGTVSNADYEADDFENLPHCTSKKEGSTAFVVENGEGYVCKGGSWVRDDKAVELVVSFGTLEDSRDGQVYKTVKIGGQNWMAENLNYDIIYSYCYEDDDSKCDRYGRLYTWPVADDACPDGWHLPSDDEWRTLISAVGGCDSAGKMLKSTNGWENGGFGTDSFGFAVLAAGIRNNGNYSAVGLSTRFWTSSGVDDLGAANYESFSYNLDNCTGYWHFKDEGTAYSVRCLQNSSNGNKDSEDSCSSSSSSVTQNISYGELKDSRDGQIYKTVKIGDQTWMAENLNYEYNEGTANSYCYDDDVTNCDKYGRLYRWSAAMDSEGIVDPNGAGKGCGVGNTCFSRGKIRGVCPSGWHLPSKEEFETLINAVGGSSVAGTMLKAVGDWNDGGGGSDDYGFSALPAGEYNIDAGFYNVGNKAVFWSASESQNRDELVYIMRMYKDLENASVVAFGEKGWVGRYSVRCLQDSNGVSDDEIEASSSSKTVPSSSSPKAESSSSVKKRAMIPVAPVVPRLRKTSVMGNLKILETVRFTRP